MSPDTSSTSPASRLTAWQSPMVTPPGLSTKKRSTQRRPSRCHSVSTRLSPCEASTGETTASTRLSQPCAASTPGSPRKKVGGAHFCLKFSMCTSRPARDRDPENSGGCRRSSAGFAGEADSWGDGFGRGASPPFGVSIMSHELWSAFGVRSGDLPDGVDDPGPLHAPVGPRRPVPDLHHPLPGEGIAHRDPDGQPQEIRVLELHPGALVPIVHEHVEARSPQIVVEFLGRRRLGPVSDGDRHHMDMEGRDGPGPDDAVLIVALL